MSDEGSFQNFGPLVARMARIGVQLTNSQQIWVKVRPEKEELEERSPTPDHYTAKKCGSMGECPARRRALTELGQKYARCWPSSISLVKRRDFFWRDGHQEEGRGAQRRNSSAREQRLAMTSCHASDPRAAMQSQEAANTQPEIQARRHKNHYSDAHLEQAARLFKEKLGRFKL